jgi:hypothetical protein
MQLSKKLLYVAIGLAFFGLVCYAAVDIRLNAGPANTSAFTHHHFCCFVFLLLRSSHDLVPQCATTAVSSMNSIPGSTSAPPSAPIHFSQMLCLVSHCPSPAPLPPSFPPRRYLVENGWTKFITWFDYESWYPIGRPIGKSIYPGMQVAAAVIHWFLGAVGYPLSLNDVCVLASLSLDTRVSKCILFLSISLCAAAACSCLPTFPCSPAFSCSAWPMKSEDPRLA